MSRDEGPAEPPGAATEESTSLIRTLQVAALLLLLTGNLYWSRPHHNWDLLAYVAVAHRLGGDSAEEAHRRAYRAARETVPAARYDLLVRSSEYRRVLARDPVAFDQQLPFYSVKPAYPALILGLERLGVNPARASLLISRVAYVGIGLVVLVWLASFLPPTAAVVGAWATMSLPFVLDLARLSSPDALSTLLVLAALWLVFHTRRFSAGALLLLLSVAVRPDNTLWVLAVAAYGAVRMHRGRIAALYSGAAFLFYFVLVTWSGTPGWRTLFHHSFVERLAYPEAFEPSLSPTRYLWIYLRESHPVNLPPFMVLFGLFGAWLFVSRIRTYGWNDPWVGLLAVAGCFAASHWLVFPDGDRFLVAGYLTIVILLIQTLAGRRPGEVGGGLPSPDRWRTEAMGP